VDNGSLFYQQDFYRWTQEQAARLRRLAQARLNLPEDLDLLHIAEEIDSMGNEQGYALESALRLTMLHLLKLEYSPARYPRRGWQDEVSEFRIQAARRLERNPGLKPQIPEMIETAYRDALRQARQALKQDQIDPRSLPEHCPYTPEQLFDPEWLPPSRHGLD